MSNVLKVSQQTTIYSLADRGCSQRRIARELGINREAVGRYLRVAEKAKPAIVDPGGKTRSLTSKATLLLGYLSRVGCRPWSSHLAGWKTSQADAATRPRRCESPVLRQIRVLAAPFCNLRFRR